MPTSHRLVIPLSVALLWGCAGSYFHDAGTPPSPPPRHALERWPYDEYWTGLVFNGDKIGFTHLSLAPQAGPESGFVIRAEAAMRFRFLAIDKQVTLTSEDRVRPDLTLAEFSYRYDLDGSELLIDGSASGGELRATVVAGGVPSAQRIPIQAPIYPTSAIALYPALHGLAVGRDFAYSVYDGETQSIAEVRQRVLAYEHSELFEGAAFKIRTTLHGHAVDTWIDAQARPVLEMSLGGVFISGLEAEGVAKRYLTLAALNKDESLLAFSRVESDVSIADPRAVSSLTLDLLGVGELAVPSDGPQRCAPIADGLRCRVGLAAAPSPAVDAAPAAYLRSTLPVPSRHRRIRELARSITAQAITDRARAQALIDWIQGNVEQQAVDVFSALDVLDRRKAECQGNTYLYAAFARALGIPTRVVNGIVYSEHAGAFVYHTWAESHLGGSWQALDPTFGQLQADATHVKLIEGETLEALAPLVALMGRLRARVVAVS